MYQIYGHFSFYLHTFKEPNNWTLTLPKNVVLDVMNHGNYFEFYLTWKTSTPTEIEEIIASSSSGMGMLLDLPMHYGYSLPPQECTKPVSQQEHADREIRFKYSIRSLQFDQALKHYTEVEIPVEKQIAKLEIENLINRTYSNVTLAEAIDNYLEALEEPEFFLPLLYKAYEKIRHSGSFRKGYFKKFSHLANNPNVLGSRHTSASITSLRGLTSTESDLCKETIRKGIMDYAKNIVIK